MRFYMVRDAAATFHVGTLDAAREAVKERIKTVGQDWRDVSVDEVEVPLDKDNVLRLLNEQGGTHQFMRQWGATKRCGLKLQEREE